MPVGANKYIVNPPATPPFPRAGNLTPHSNTTLSPLLLQSLLGSSSTPPIAPNNNFNNNTAGASSSPKAVTALVPTPALVSAPGIIPPLSPSAIQLPGTHVTARNQKPPISPNGRSLLPQAVQHGLVANGVNGVSPSVSPFASLHGGAGGSAVHMGTMNAYTSVAGGGGLLRSQSLTLSARASLPTHKLPPPSPSHSQAPPGVNINVNFTPAPMTTSSPTNATTTIADSNTNSPSNQLVTIASTASAEGAPGTATATAASTDA